MTRAHEHIPVSNSRLHRSVPSQPCQQHPDLSRANPWVTGAQSGVKSSPDGNQQQRERPAPLHLSETTGVWKHALGCRCYHRCQESILAHACISSPSNNQTGSATESVITRPVDDGTETDQTAVLPGATGRPMSTWHRAPTTAQCPTSLPLPITVIPGS